MLPKELRFNFYKSFKSLPEYKRDELIYNGMIQAYFEEMQAELTPVRKEPATVTPLKVVSDRSDVIGEGWVEIPDEYINPDSEK